MFQTKVVQKIKNTHFVFRKIVFFLKDNVEKYCKSGQATDDNVAYVHCMLDKKTTDTHNTHIAFPLQWLQEHVSVLH
jgi:hypothetical protein